MNGVIAYETALFTLQPWYWQTVVEAAAKAEKILVAGKVSHLFCAGQIAHQAQTGKAAWADEMAITRHGWEALQQCGDESRRQRREYGAHLAAS